MAAPAFHTVWVGDTCFTILTRYQNLEILASGGQGVVCKAMDTETRRRVAIKKLDRPFRNSLSARRALREFQIMKIVIKLLNAFTPQASPHSFTEMYLVTELMDANLYHVIKTIDLNHDQISFLVYQILCGLKYLHAAGLVHRDLTPANIAVKSDCSLKILDLGLARSAAENMSPYVVCRYYRAPEIVLGLPYTANVDIWSVACIMAEMISGNLLFYGEDQLELWHKITQLLGTPSPEFLDRLLPAVRRVVNGMPFESGQTIYPEEHFPSDPRDRMKAMQARDLLVRMLVIDSSRRISVNDALADVYMMEHRSVAAEETDENLAINDTNDNLGNRFSEDQWKTLIFTELEEYMS